MIIILKYKGGSLLTPENYFEMHQNDDRERKRGIEDMDR
jgi:hypothetical protein